MKKITEQLKNFGGLLVGLVFFLLLISVPILFIFGGIRIFKILIENRIVEWINGVAFLSITLLLILSLFSRLRLMTGNGLIVVTYIEGAVLWLICLYLTYIIWGLFAVFVGLLFFGIGIFPVAILALLFNGQFLIAFMLILSLAIIYGLRLLGVWIISKHSPTQEAIL